MYGVFPWFIFYWFYFYICKWFVIQLITFLKIFLWYLIFCVVFCKNVCNLVVLCNYPSLLFQVEAQVWVGVLAFSKLTSLCHVSFQKTFCLIALLHWNDFSWVLFIGSHWFFLYFALSFTFFTPLCQCTMCQNSPNWF